MKKGYLVGGLAIVGAIALFAYIRKPKMNSEGFFGATGGRGSSGTKSKSTTLCMRRNADGSSTSYSPQGGSRPCPYGGVITTAKSSVLTSPRIRR